MTGLDDAAIVPLVSMARHPYVFANNERVGVVFNDQAGAIYLYVSQAGGALSFGQPTLVGTDIVTVFRDFPTRTGRLPQAVGHRLVGT